MSLAHDTTNDQRLADFMSDVRELGRDSAKGKDALPSLAIRVSMAVRDGVIDTVKDSSNKDDIDRVYDAYVDAESKKAKHEHTAGGKAANCSKLRAIASASMLDLDFVDVLERTTALRAEMKEKKFKVESAYTAFVNAARKQLDPANQSAPVTDDQLRECIEKNTKVQTLEEKLGAIYKAINAIADDREAEPITGHLADMATLAREAILTIDGEVPAVTKEEKAKAELLRKAKQMGLVLTHVELPAAAE